MTWAWFTENPGLYCNHNHYAIQRSGFLVLVLVENVVEKTKEAKYRVVYFTGTPQFPYQKENRQADNHSTGFTGTAALIS